MYNSNLNPPYKGVMTHLRRNALFLCWNKICHDERNDRCSNIFQSLRSLYSLHNCGKKVGLVSIVCDTLCLSSHVYTSSLFLRYLFRRCQQILVIST